MKNKIIRIALLFLTGIWILGFTFPVFFQDSSISAVMQTFLSKFYGTVCHQDTNKVCLCNSSAFLVCARCSGIYFGILAGVFLSFFFPKPLKLKIILIAAFILLLDVFLSTIRIYTYSKTFAFCSGLFFGTVLFLYIQDVIFKIFNKKA